MEQYLESLLIIGKTSQLPTSSAVLEHQCELFKSRRITGILLCGHGHFMAVLEGQPLALQSVIKQSIRNDESPHLIHRATISERGYRYWNIHITDNVQKAYEDDLLVSKLISKQHKLDKQQNNHHIIKEIVAYYYCEYIVSSVSCTDYRQANIA